MARFLVTGGAGYVGSHTVLALRDRGDDVVVVDNLRQGHRRAVPRGVDLIVEDVGDRRRMDEVFASWRFDGVLHFAALSIVGESMREPMHYITQNLGNTLCVADAAVKAGCRRFVLSSTAALFGCPQSLPIDEAATLCPVSPYGESKLMAERGLEWMEQAHGLRSAALRYFNAAGADPGGRLGEDHDPETHLIPLAIDAALGLRPELVVYGQDYDTPDGTCVRDYVHVSDLAAAHLHVLDALDRTGSCRYNVGNGTGHSVREVIAAVERVSGRRVPHRYGDRRPGDPAALVASSRRLREETGWTPRYAALDEIVRTAWNWRSQHPAGYGELSVTRALAS
ncbi:UDP-glucose 4-epimerase GalE [Roseomonas elaeocarpi]|uniref:UDP-glucose 4-epimerase n=1 Tax=Roseomonas elaeocarpi TaxID=907779 RepID=A0ABV6JY18_9PROT